MRAERAALGAAVACLAACAGQIETTATDSGFDAGTLDASVRDSGPGDAGRPLEDGGTDAGVADAGHTAKPVFVIGGQDMRHLVSFDGTSWLNDSYVAPTGLDNAFSGVAVGAGGIVLSGDPGIYRSTDGVVWQQVQAPGSGYSFHSSQALYAGGLMVVVAGDRAWWSSDGISWQYDAGTGASGHWHGLAYGNGRWVALGDGLRKVSEDAMSWHDLTAFDPSLFQGIAFGNQRFVAVGKANDAGWVATSPDGLVFTTQASIPTPYATGLAAVGFGDGVFMTSTCCATLTSPDGVTWTTVSPSGAGGSIAYVGGTFISAGWRTEARVYDADAGRWISTFTGDHPNRFNDAGLAPWFTGVGAGEL